MTSKCVESNRREDGDGRGGSRGVLVRGYLTNVGLGREPIMRHDYVKCLHGNKKKKKKKKKALS